MKESGQIVLFRFPHHKLYLLSLRNALQQIMDCAIQYS
jgi:hypothetical protein